MHQYWYVNSTGSGQLLNNQFSVPPFYSQPLIPKLRGINGLGIPGGWNCRFYPAGWKIPWGGYRAQPVHSTSPAGQMGSTAQESSSGWITPVYLEDFTSHGHNGNLIQLVDQDDDWESHELPANWPQLPDYQGIAPKGQLTSWAQPIHHAGMFAEGQPLGGSPTAGHGGFNPQKHPFHWKQPIDHAGMMTQGHSASVAPSAGHVGFNSQKQPFPWPQPVNHTGMFAQGHNAAWQPPLSNPFGFGSNGKLANFGGLGNPTAWGGQVNPMGWGNNGGNGQPGILGGIFKMGKGTMNGIGILSSLISVGKFLF